jgi:hypothetical protein
MYSCVTVEPKPSSIGQERLKRRPRFTSKFGNLKIDIFSLYLAGGWSHYNYFDLQIERKASG